MILEDPQHQRSGRSSLPLGIEADVLECGLLTGLDIAAPDALEPQVVGVHMELLSIGVEKHQAAFSSGTWLTGTPLTYLAPW